MKVAPLHKAFRNHASSFRHLIVHTGQHYDEAMSKVFFEDLELPHPDFFLGIGSGSHAVQTAKIMIEFEKVLQEQKPHLVVVVGDVNSTVACSLVSVKLGIQVAHVEAGLRSFDRTMPEEINRLLTDAVAEHLFVTEPSGVGNLLKEGIDEEKIHLVGNIMIDSLIHYQKKARSRSILEKVGLESKKFMLVTLHRPSNVDEKRSLERILDLFEELARKTVIAFPVHPRTRKMLEEFGLSDRVRGIKALKLLDPVGYLEFLNLMEHAQLVLTDSGGIQEETTFLGIPCLTMRENTERPVTVDVGTNELCGMDGGLALTKSLDILNGKQKTGSIPDLWDGKTGERIVDILVNKYRE